MVFDTMIVYALCLVLDIRIFTDNELETQHVNRNPCREQDELGGLLLVRMDEHGTMVTLVATHSPIIVVTVIAQPTTTTTSSSPGDTKMVW